MYEKKLFTIGAHFFYVVLLCVIVMIESAACASINSTANDDLCTTSNLRTDIRPNLDGPLVEISVGIRMLDLTKISDINKMLEGGFAVVLTWMDPRL